jgi:predicted HD phosphohydrolase
VILTIDDIERLLASGADRPVEVAETDGIEIEIEIEIGIGIGIGIGTHPPDGTGTHPSGEMPFTHLDHALQTAAVLRQEFPDDIELAVAGLVHDIGHLLPGVGDAEHAEAGAEAIRAALGDGVAGPVGLHVEAKRYLVARQSAYGEVLAADSVASLALQGGPMSADEQQDFEKRPHAARALDLRRADERGKVDGLVVAGLGEWMELVRALYPSPTT